MGANKINMEYLWDNYGKPNMIYLRPRLRVHVDKPTFWHVEGVTTGLHHSSAQLRLPFQASKGVQCAAISVRDHVLA